jgi:plastocyanin
MNATASAQTSLSSNALPARGFYARIAALGFLLIALAGAIGAIVSVSGGDTGALSFTLPIVIIAVLIAGALMRFGTWAQVLAAVLSLLLLALLLPFSLFNLFHPESAGDFIPVVLITVGAAFGLVGSIVTLVQRRRRLLRTAATPVESVALKVILIALALAALGSIAMTATARTAISAEARANASSVDIRNFEFSPNQLQVKAGDSVRVVVKNSDTTLHTFTLPEAGVDVSVPPGTEKLVEFKAPKAGEYRWYCIPHSSDGPYGRTGMVGLLVVQ